MHDIFVLPHTRASAYMVVIVNFDTLDLPEK